jgi:hypothetical protein
MRARARVRGIVAITSRCGVDFDARLLRARGIAWLRKSENIGGRRYSASRAARESDIADFGRARARMKPHRINAARSRRRAVETLWRKHAAVTKPRYFRSESSVSRPTLPVSWIGFHTRDNPNSHCSEQL